jgi:exosortase
VIVLALAVGVLYRRVLPAWIGDLWVDPNYSHGLLVPGCALWLAYERRDQLLKLTPRPAPSAVIVVIGALAMLMVGVLAAELFVTRLSLVLLIVGLVGFILGYAYLRVLAWPLGFLLFMVPLPTLVFNAIALPLQFLASRLAVDTLRAAGVPALREGNVILLPNISLEVVEACSGLRSLISLSAVAVLLAALTLRRTAARLVLIMSSLPIAVVTNGARIALTGIIAYVFGAKTAEGFFHGFSGWLVFIAALGLLAGEAGMVRALQRE